MKSKQIIYLIILLGFALRLFRLDYQPLWGDEGWSVYAASLPLLDMVAVTAVDIHPPFYYALLHIWGQIMGSGPEIARLLSVIFGTLLIPIMYCFGRYLMQQVKIEHPPKSSPGERKGNKMRSRGFDKIYQPCPSSRLLSPSFPALLTAFAPLAVYYSQEVRMYGLVTLLGAISTFLFVRLISGDHRVWWLYGLTLVLALSTMYYACFIVAFHGLYLLLFSLIAYQNQSVGKKLSRNIWQSLGRAYAALGLTGSLYLPWAMYAGPKLLTYVAEKADIEGYHSLSLFQFFSHYLKAFSLGHLSPAYQLLSWGTIFFGGLVILGIVLRISEGLKNNDVSLLLIAYLLVPLLLGWIINLRNPFTPPYFERTLLIAAPAWWLLIALGLITIQRWWQYGGQLMLGISIIFYLPGLTDFYLTPRYVDADYRPLLAEVAAIAGPEDIILASYPWQLGYYHAYLPQTHPKPYPIPDWGRVWGQDYHVMRRDLRTLLAHPIWFPAHQTQGRIWENEAENILIALGYPVLLKWYNINTKLSLFVPPMPLQISSQINFEQHLQADVSLSSQTVYESGRGVIPVEIEWTALNDITQDYLISLKLVDSQGEIWAIRDASAIRNTPPQPRPDGFAGLSSGDSFSDRHALLISAGTPPGSYHLVLSLTNPAAEDKPLDILDSQGYPQGVDAFLTEITITPAGLPVGKAALAVQTPLDSQFDTALNLVGYQIGLTPVEAGYILPVNLFWQGLKAPLPEFTMFVQLQDDQGQAVALTERPPIYPTTAWSEGTLLRDLHALHIPATLPAGRYRLAAGVLSPDTTRLNTRQGDQVVLGHITVTTRPRHFDPPKPDYEQFANFGGGTLVGFDLNKVSLQASDSLILSTYWQGTAGFKRSWTIFVHLVDTEGRRWSQRDQLPGAGQFPTTTWVEGEYITDVRQIPLPPDILPGSYMLLLGLYDAKTFERLPLVEGGDSIRLKQILQIIQN